MGRNIKPISPDEIKKPLPEFVIEIFNELLKEKYIPATGEAVVGQKELLAKFAKRGHSSEEVFNNHWFDIEKVYKSNGWNVKYEKPTWDEQFEAYFLFSKK